MYRLNTITIMKHYLQFKVENLSEAPNFDLTEQSKSLKADSVNQFDSELNSKSVVKAKKSNLAFVFFFTLMFSLFGFVQNTSSQTTISQWIFEPLQGTNANPTPNTGLGSASLVGSMIGFGGTATGMLLSGNGCGTQTGANPGAWAISTANPGTTNESSGAQFNVSTVGRSGIIVQWDQRFSNTSTNTVRLQYTTDGSTWNNFTMTASNTTLCAGSLNNGRFENNAGDVYRRVIVNLSAITAVDNNSNFAFRAVAAHYQSIGQFRQSGTTASVATVGTWRFDNVTVSGTVIPANPTVNLSVSANSGTEAGTTAITVTATASSAVSADQTLALGISGTNITTGDYSLSNSTITILNGQTSGSVTFTVVDDTVVESLETATLSISSPSSGITLGTTTSQNISITDNDVAPNPIVSLFVSANAGTEAGATAITVTATADAAVTGDQTVNIGVSGTDVTAGDYSLSNSTITILNGQTTGSVTFTVTDDLLVESTEIATLTISSPSAGITLGTITSENITITDNDVAAPNLNIDLSTYVRVGRYNLPEPTRTTAPANNLLCQEASAVAYNWDTDTLFITADGSTSVTQVSKTGQLIDTMTMALGGSPQGTEFYDTEGLTYIGGGQFVMSEERDRQLVKFTYAAGTTLTRANTQTVKIGTFVPNTGTEGLSYDPLTGGYIVLKEITPIGIFQTGVDFNAGTATNGSATTENSTNLFDPALLGFSDVADVFALSNIPALNGQPLYNNLLVLGQENAKVVNVNRSGVIANTLTIVSDAGNPLDVASQQHEGLTMDRDGNLYIVSENGGGTIDFPQLWVYAPSTVPNQAPTAIALTNTTTSILENSNTTAIVKVADISVTDDGLGTNNLTLSGADANYFQITGSSLYIKAGTVLDFETKTSYSVTVNVDDTTIGATPDASVNFVLNVTDVVVETVAVVSVSVTEMAPWSSSAPSVLADWFEVTNNGTAALDITGWRVDDSSNSFTAALPLTGITSIAPGESVIFLETSATNAVTIIANFKATWFGSNVPTNVQVGSYTGGGIGLSTGGDAVNLFNAAGVVQTNVSFGAATTNFTFNNAASLSNSAITTLSQVGVNGAFAAVNDTAQIGSPGSVGKLFISEVAPWSSGNSPVGSDWFEVTNTKAVAVDITGWKIDDNSQSPVGAVALNGITSINPGESVIFIETADLAGKTTTFLNNWFGTNPSSGLRIGNYTGSGVGLGTGGDQVNLYNATSNIPQASVLFGASPTVAPFTTFDNASGLSSLTTAITQFSAVGTNGAFIAANSTSEIGSPGTIRTAPCPTITATATPALATICFGATTTVTVTATGGTLPYTVTGSPLTVGGGTFTYTITDAKGCIATATTTVTSLPLPTVNLSVSTNTASETAGTVVTVAAIASAPVCVDETLSIDVTGLGITAADYILSNATITIPSGATTGSVTFTVVSDNAVEALETAVLTISNPSSGIALGTASQNIAISDFTFTLQVLHASDFEGAVEAVQDAPRFAAIVDVLEDTYTNTIKLSSGDNYIPGPFLSSGEDPSLSAALKTAYESYFNTTFSSSAINLLPSIGRADISILNFIGIEASALGNHEFDLGTTEVRNIIRGANSSATVRSWFGAQFPYLSSNLNFSGDSNLSAIATTNRLLPNTSFMSSPTETVTAITNKLKLAPSTIVIKGGQKIGIVGATTQVLASISSPGATTVVGGGANDMNILAGIIQPVVNSLIADGCNKIILLSHLQQIAFEKELAGKLTGVDIIMAGGSNTLMADANDRLRAGDMASESYPFLTTGLDGKTLALINTDGNYKYVGRLVVDFDADGTLIPSSINPVISGVYAADAQGLNDAWGANVGNAFAVGTRGYQVQLLCNAIGNVITVKDGNLFGKTSVFLEGRRNFVRTEETNLGNITAEANLWLAKLYDPTTVISIKNGGGIRSAIGNVNAVGDNVTYGPTIANPSAGKQSGDISQLDIENSLRFNNQLSLMTLTASGLRSILEHAVRATTATATPGQFAQVAGVRYSYDFSLAAGSRILNAVITDASGNAIDNLVVNGTTVGDLSRTFRVVTLNFLAGGGDSYPFNTLGTNRSDLNTIPEQGPATASFTNAGSEQDAFAEYMKNQFSTTPYAIAETALAQDCRIQRVPARADNVLPPSAGTNGTLVICNATTVTQVQLFAALGGTPAIGGSWSPVLASAGVYTYTVTSPSCAGSASATVTVTETNLLASATAETISCFGGTTTVTVSATGGAAPYTGTGTFTVSAGAYSYSVTDANSCTVTTSVTIAEGTALTDNVTDISACDNYTWNGITYSTSGLYTGTTTNCVTEKLNLTIVPSPKAGTSGTLSVTTGTIPTNAQLFGALIGTPDAGGTWTISGLVYTYTVPATSPCTVAATATVTVIEAIPTTMSFCQGAKLSSAVGTTSLKFYSAAIGGGALPLTTTLTSRTLFATQTVNGVESTPRVAIAITVNSLPSEVLGVITSNTASATPSGFAAASLAVGQFVGTTTAVSYRIPAFGDSGLTYLWKVPVGVTILGQAANVTEVTQTGANANVLNVNFANVGSGVGIIGAISVQAVNATGCVGRAKSITVLKVLPTASTAIRMTNAALPLPGSGIPTAITSFAPYMGTNTELTLTATPAATATSYVWELPTGVNVTNGSAANIGGVILSTSNVISVNFLGVTSTNTNNYTSTSQVSTNNLRIGVRSNNGVGLSITNNAALANSSASFLPNSTSTARLLTLTAVRPAAPSALKMFNTAVSSTATVTDISRFVGTSTTLTLVATPSAFASSYSWELPTIVNFIGGDITSNTITVNFANVPAGTTSLYIGVKAVNGIGSSITNNSALTSPATISEARLLKVTAKAPAVAGTVVGSLAICPTTASNVTYSIAIAAVGANSYNVTAPLGCTINGGTTNTTSIAATPGATFTVNYPAAFVANTTTAIRTITIQSVNGFGVSTTNKVLRLTNVGAVCTTSTVRKADRALSLNEFEAVAYPVPSFDVINIEIQSSSKEASQVQVYDMQGRLIDNFKSNETSFQLGTNYPTGVYNVVVSQGLNVKTLKVIKK